MASLPAVAPAPKMAALPNFLPADLSHSPCWGFGCGQRTLSSTIESSDVCLGRGMDGVVIAGVWTYLWVLGVGGMVWVCGPV